MFLKEFEVRWSDIDANRHLANSAYFKFTGDTRMAHMETLGINQMTLAKYNLGPVVFFENMFYFKEAFAGRPIKVSSELTGASEDGMFFEFKHDFYDGQGKNFARSQMIGAWIDLKARKLTPLPSGFWEALEKVEKAPEFRILTKEDTRRFGEVPKDLGV